MRRVGPSGANKIRSVRAGAMGIETGPWTPGSAPSTWRSANCVQASTSRQWLLQRRKRSETALITVVADCYLAGVSTRRMDKLVKTLGITGLSKSQVSRMATDLDEHVEQFRNRPLDDAGPFTFVAADALTMNVRKGGRVWAARAASISQTWARWSPSWSAARTARSKSWRYSSE